MWGLVCTIPYILSLFVRRKAAGEGRAEAPPDQPLEGRRHGRRRDVTPDPECDRAAAGEGTGRYPKMTSPGAAVPKPLLREMPYSGRIRSAAREAPRRLLLLLRRLADRALARRSGLLGGLLRALLGRLLLHSHNRTPEFVVVCGSARAPPRLFHYAQKINKPLPRSENSNGKMDFAARVAAPLEPAAQPLRASDSAGGVWFTA